MNGFRPCCCIALALLFAAGCGSGPEPARVPAPAPPRNPLAALVEQLKQNARAPRAEDQASLLSAIQSAVPSDPDPLLSALKDSELVLGNRQAVASERDLARAGEQPGQGQVLPLLQEIIVDGGGGVFRLVYLLRVRSAGSFLADKKDVFTGEGGRRGDVVAVSGRIVEASFLSDGELFDSGTAWARLESPDWRVAGASLEALFRGQAPLEWMLKRGVRLFAREAGGDERGLCLLSLQGLPGPAYSAAAVTGSEAGKKIGEAYALWFDEGSRDWKPGGGAGHASAGPDSWSALLDAFLAAAIDSRRPAAERADAFAAGLIEFGHGSDLPRTHTDPASPRSYVDVLSPRLRDWFSAMLAASHAEAPVAAVAVAAGADAYLRALLMEQSRGDFLRAVVLGLAVAPPHMRLKALAWLEQATGCLFPGFDPFGTADARAAAAAEMAARLSRTGFKERGEEAERLSKINSARRALESMAVMQRKVLAEKKAHAADLGEVLRTGLGSAEAARSSGFIPGAGGRWSTRDGFELDLALAGGGFVLTARGRPRDGEPETLFRYDSARGMVEMLPP